MNNAKTLIVVALVGILILSVASSGCIVLGEPDLRPATTLTATWKAAVSGGFQVYGKLTDSDGNALGGMTVALGGERDGKTNEAVKTTTTNTNGEYRIALTSQKDVWKNYGTSFQGIGTSPNGYKPSGWNVMMGYKGLVAGVKDFKATIQYTPSSQWQPGKKSVMLVGVNGFALQIQDGRYSAAANALQRSILPNVSPTPGKTSNWINDAPLQKNVYNAMATAINDCRLLSGQITESSTSEADTVYTPALIPQQT
jgi:hypothetical protein